MSTKIRIGRFEGEARAHVQGLGRSSRGLTLSGLWFAGSLRESEQMAEQLAALADIGDEAIVPLVWGGTSADSVPVTGFYRVQPGGVSVDGSAGTAGVGVQTYSVSLERVLGFSAPLFESTILGSGRLVPTAAAGAANAPSPWMALPASVRGFELGVDRTPLYADRQTEDGPITVFRSPELWNAHVQFFVPPEQWYVGAATLRVGGSVVVGKQALNTPDEWSMSNGLVRVSGTAEGFLVEGWRDGQWGDPLAATTVRRNLDLGTEEFVSTPHTLTVLRNSPEEVIVRLTMDAASATAGARFSVVTDLSLRRGARTVSIRTVSRGNYNWGLEVAGYPSGSWNTHNDGVSREGYVLGRDRYSSVAAATGGKVRVRTLGDRGFNNPFVAALGYCHPSAAPGNVDSAQDVLNQWTAVQSEWVDAVRR